jgi:hypothetical protein
MEGNVRQLTPNRVHTSERQTPGLTQGSPLAFEYKRGGEPRVKPWVWRPEMWAQDRYPYKPFTLSLYLLHVCVYGSDPDPARMDLLILVL